VTAFHCENMDSGFRGPSYFFLFAALHIGLFPSTKMWTFVGWKIFQIHPIGSCLVLYGNFYLPLVLLQRMQDFCITWICSFHPNLKSVSMCLAMALHVLFHASARFWLNYFLFFAAAEGWTYFLCVPVRNFTKTTTESKTFTTSFILSVPKKKFCEVLSELELGRGFSTLLVAR
jgi:hypothetical protein